MVHVKVPAATGVAPASIGHRAPADGARPLPPYDTVPRFRVGVRAPGRAPGLLFASLHSLDDPRAVHGPQILDDAGRPVWFRPLPEGTYATDLRVQRYHGRPVLTWWEGGATATGVGIGSAYVMDETYEIVAHVRTAGGGEPIDLHEFVLTDEGTAILVSYQVRTHDLTPAGGPVDGRLMDSVVEEIDLETGDVLLHWSGAEHVDLAESHLPPALVPDIAWDHLHVNSVAVDEDGHLLVTARNTSAVYKVHRRTGEVLWRYGSGASTFPLGPAGVRCNWQHDAQPAGNGVYRLFDNGGNNHFAGYESRVVWVRLDEAAGTLTHVRTLTHPEHVCTIAEGNAEDLPGGNTLVGWGWAGRISEFSPAGELLFDATTPPDGRWTTYRVYRSRWHGRPATRPELTTERTARGTRLHATWNGATGIERWRLLAGPRRDVLAAVSTTPWDGLDTTLALPAGEPASYARIEALDARGAVLGGSDTVPLASGEPPG